MKGFFVVLLATIVFASVEAKSFSIKNAQFDEKAFMVPLAVPCNLCEYLAQQLLEVLAANSTAADVEAFLSSLCKALPGSARPMCEEFAAKVAGIIPVLSKAIQFEDISPQDMCGLLQACTIPCCLSSLPEQLHLAATPNPTEMIFSWITAAPVDSIVQYGLSANQLDKQVNGSIHTYTSGNWVGWIHNTKITGLSLNTQYYYRVGSMTNGFSQVYHFTTFTGASQPFKMVVIGDMGADSQSDNTVARLQVIAQNQQVNAILHAGDISYADGIQRRWDQYMRKVEPIAAYLPYMVIPGNHEIAIVQYLGLMGYINRYGFLMPVNSAPDPRDFQSGYYWSVNYGLAHIIGLDTEHMADIAFVSNDQLAWLEKDLQAAVANRAQQPWIIVMGHRPLYCSSTRSDCTLLAAQLRQTLEDMFVKYHVDIVITAHIHSYERTYPLYRGQWSTNFNNPAYPVYIINGAGGNREGTSNFRGDPAGWSASRIKDWGYATMDVNSTSLSWSFFTSSDGVLRDSFTLTK